MSARTLNRTLDHSGAIGIALALALGSAISLGLARFSYALLLPPMRTDLGWSYATAGLMNTVNALGYLTGASLTPWVVRRIGPRATLIAGAWLAVVFLLGHGLTRADAPLYALRWLIGAASAWMFVSGGLLAAESSMKAAGTHPSAAGLILGIYYGGTGVGIVACAALLPPLIGGGGAMAAMGGSQGRAPGIAPNIGSGDALGLGLAGWQWGWLALATLAALTAIVMALTTRATASLRSPMPARRERFAMRAFAMGLAAYFMFGLGYIGYMTFIVTLLREQRMGGGVIAAFYALLGLGVMVSPWLWARLLQRHRDGRPLAVLSALLALATALPVALPNAVAAFISGALFGAVFLSVVASTTALVRHNLPREQWPAGIGAFTIVFAVGQTIGPVAVGWLSDGRGGLSLGLAASAAMLLIGALLAARQRALAMPGGRDPG